MPTASPQKTWYHSNQYSADTACRECQGVIRHEPWCITLNPRVVYAYDAVADAGRLTLEDELILHALGVRWANNSCQGTCRK
jgi:hypothetical protein